MIFNHVILSRINNNTVALNSALSKYALIQLNVISKYIINVAYLHSNIILTTNQSSKCKN